MAEEQKSRLTGLVGLITAVTGLIAALVALSGALKSHLASEPSNAAAATTPNAAVATTTNAAAPANGVVAFGPAGQRRLTGSVASQSGAIPLGRNTGGGTVQVDHAVDSGATHESPADAGHAEPQVHDTEPDPAPADESSTPEGE